MLPTRLAVILSVTLGTLAGCSTPEEGASAADPVVGRPFVDVSAARPLADVARSKIVAAISELERVAANGAAAKQRALAAETLRIIRSGHVKLGSLAGSRGFDRWRMCKGLGHPACATGSAPRLDDDTWGDEPSLTAGVVEAVLGYTSGNRLYFALHDATDVTELASTLVHEVNHVLNHTDCAYFSDYAAHVIAPEKAFVEEYRAFLTECFFTKRTATPDTCHAAALEGALRYDLNVDIASLVPAGQAPTWLARQMVRGDASERPTHGWMTPTEERFPRRFPVCGTE